MFPSGINRPNFLFITSIADSSMERSHPSIERAMSFSVLGGSIITEMVLALVYLYLWTRRSSLGRAFAFGSCMLGTHAVQSFQGINVVIKAIINPRMQIDVV
jgi:hypothetical protein